MANISFTTAKAARRVGVNMSSKIRYDDFGNPIYSNTVYDLKKSINDGSYVCVSQDDLCNYLRDKHRYYFSIFYIKEIESWCFEIRNQNNESFTWPYEIINKNYEVAFEKALFKTLEIITTKQFEILFEDKLTY